MKEHEKTEYERFSDATKHLMSIPKKEIDKRHEKWLKEKEKKRESKTSRSSHVSNNRKGES